MGGKWNRWKTPIKDEDGDIRKEYVLWSGFMNRAGKYKTYKNVTVSDNFRSYDYFFDWYNKQVGAHCTDINGRPFELDKDIVGDGSLYSEDVCVLVPKELNSQFKRYNKRNNTLPLGVSKEDRKNLYRASLSINGKFYNLGYYETPEQASKVYNQKRKERSIEIINLYPLDPRVTDILLNKN